MAANAKFLLVGLEPKELCVLIAPPAHEDRETSVNGEAKSSIEWCIVIPVVRAEPLWMHSGEPGSCQVQRHVPVFLSLVPPVFLGCSGQDKSFMVSMEDAQITCCLAAYHQ